MSPKALGVEPEEPPARLVSVSPPRSEREAEMLDGTPAEVAGALMDRIEATLAAP